MALLGRVAVITGGAGGIGRETSLRLAEEGALVVCGDFDVDAGATLMEESAKRAHAAGRVLFARFDASRKEDCLNLVKEALNHFGRVDILFNNVGIQPKSASKPLHETPDDAWDAVHTVNVKSHFWMCKEVLPIMMKQGKGVIIENASIQGLQSQAVTAAYASSKGAILALTREIAIEYGQYGVRCVSICPGSIVTPMCRDNTDLSYVTANTPLGFLGEPRDIADTVVFLASDAARWITGQNFVVDGGITVKGGWAALPARQQ